MEGTQRRKNLMVTALLAVAAAAALLLVLLVVVLRTRAQLWTVVLMWGAAGILGLFTAVVLWYLAQLLRLQRGGVLSHRLLSVLRLLVHELYPPLLWLTGFITPDRDALNGAYVELNNTIIQGLVGQAAPERTLLLLPHCLQWFDCPHKVAGDGSRCVACGRCLIGDLKAMTQEMGLPLVIATGGTLARKAIRENRPELIIAVACERDLAAGIYDMRRLPVVGLLNQRPEGPCRNTRVDMEALRALIARFVRAVT